LDASQIHAMDTEYIYTAAPGQYALSAIVVDWTNQKLYQVGPSTTIIGAVPPPIPPVPPVPPTPPDPLTASINAAWLVESPVDKALAPQLSQLYQYGAAQLNTAPAGLTALQLWQTINVKAMALGVKGKLPNVQQAVANALLQVLPDPTTHPSDPVANSATAAALFTKAATIVGGLK
jgi:hypothetical protein